MGARFLQDLPVEVIVELGRTRMTIRQLAALDRDDIVDLDRTNDEPLDIVVGGKLFARGEVVMHGDRLALRIIEMMEDNERGS